MQVLVSKLVLCGCWVNEMAIFSLDFCIFLI